MHRRGVLDRRYRQGCLHYLVTGPHVWFLKQIVLGRVPGGNELLLSADDPWVQRRDLDDLIAFRLFFCLAGQWYWKLPAGRNLRVGKLIDEVFNQHFPGLFYSRQGPLLFLKVFLGWRHRSWGGRRALAEIVIVRLLFLGILLRQVKFSLRLDYTIFNVEDRCKTLWCSVRTARVLVSGTGTVTQSAYLLRRRACSLHLSNAKDDVLMKLAVHR